MHYDFLLTTAEVSGALLGFVGVVLILGRRAEGLLSRPDQTGLFHLVYSAAGALFFSLAAAACLASFDNHELVWRVALGLNAAYMSFGVFKAEREGRGGDNRLGKLTRVLLSAVTFVVIAANVAIAGGLFSAYAGLAYVLSITLMIVVAVVYFVPLVFLETNESGG